VLVLGANLAVDRTLRMSRLAPGQVQRPRSADVTGGGKAVNVCRAALAHGVRPRLIANLPGAFGHVVGDLLGGEGHDLRPVPTSGEIRSATIIIEDDLRTTVLNEPGPPLAPADRGALLTAVTEELPGHAVLVLTGSLPPGDNGLYGEIVALARDRGLTVVLDAARQALAAALPFRPHVVTPNLGEAWTVLGLATEETVEPESSDVRGDAVKAAIALRQAGAGTALVTAGRFGVAGAHPSGEFWVAAPPVAVVNPIGAGDSFVAGLAVGEALPEAALRAVATATASVTTPLAGHVDPAVYRRLRAGLAWEPA
jgi:1-phosphofructokinase family hexose kinase